MGDGIGIGGTPARFDAKTGAFGGSRGVTTTKGVAPLKPGLPVPSSSTKAEVLMQGRARRKAVFAAPEGVLIQDGSKPLLLL